MTNNSQERDRSFPSVQPECDRDVWDAQPANQPKENEDGRKAGMVDAAAGSLCGVALAEGPANAEGEEPLGMGQERVAAAKLIANYIEAYDANPSINYIRLNRKEAEQIAAALASPARAIPEPAPVAAPAPVPPLTDEQIEMACALLAAPDKWPEDFGPTAQRIRRAKAAAVLSMAASGEQAPHGLSGEQEGAWISVEDRLPEHEATVLISGFVSNDPTKERFTVVAVFHKEGLFYHPDEGDDFYPPTHWQPLPAAPSSQAAKGDGS